MPLIKAMKRNLTPKRVTPTTEHLTIVKKIIVKTEAPANLDLQTKVIVACARSVLPRLIVSKISMSVQQETTTAAMSPSARTPLVHIAALVRKDMLETEETAQISMSVQQENAIAAMWPYAKTPLAHITALVKKDMLETEEAAQILMNAKSSFFPVTSMPIVTIQRARTSAHVRLDVLGTEKRVQVLVE